MILFEEIGVSLRYLYIVLGKEVEEVHLVKWKVMLSVLPPKISAEDRFCYSFSTGQIYSVYNEMQNLLYEERNKTLRVTFVPISVGPEIVQTIEVLRHLDKQSLLRFILMHMLSIERERGTALLMHFLSPNADLFELVYHHRLEPWSVSTYARKLGLTNRKFNLLFIEAFGMSAKNWLLRERLSHAKYLLETTTQKIIDILLVSGFTNPAHFSDCFRRHFYMTPTEARRKRLDESNMCLFIN